MENLRSSTKDIERFLTTGVRSRLFQKRNGAMRLSERSSFLMEELKTAHPPNVFGLPSYGKNRRARTS